jgi:hypothetical protein
MRRCLTRAQQSSGPASLLSLHSAVRDHEGRDDRDRKHRDTANTTAASFSAMPTIADNQPPRPATTRTLLDTVPSVRLAPSNSYPPPPHIAPRGPRRTGPPWRRGNDTPWNRADDDCDGNNRLPPRDWEAYDSACVRRTAREYGRNLDRVLGEIVALRNGRPAARRVTDDYNDVIGDPHLHAATVPAALRSTRGVLDAYSALTCQIARRHQAVCIDTYHKFNGARGVRDAGALLAADHTHPNYHGHVVIARLLTRSGVTPLHR